MKSGDQTLSIGELTEGNTSLSVSLSFAIAAGLIWSYLVRDLGLFSSFDVMSKNIIVGAMIACFGFLYRGISIPVSIHRRDCVHFLLFFAVIVVVNWPVIREAIACDELYHAGMSSIAVRVVEKYNINSVWGRFFGDRPMTESVSLLSFGVVACALLMGYLWRCVVNKIQSYAQNRIHKENQFIQKLLGFSSVWLIAILIGQACRTLPMRGEVHPPLRLLPLFISQTFFGYDDFSFRLPGIITLAFIATCLARFVISKRKSDLFIGTLVGVLVCMIPIVAHAATIVEPSIWCFATWMFTFILVDRFIESKDERYFIAAGVVIGLGSLMRQNAIVLWPIMVLAILICRPSLLGVIRGLVPGMFVIPYLWSVTKSQHAAASNASFTNVLSSFQNFESVNIIMRSTTEPWIVVALIIATISVLKRWWKDAPGLLIVLSIVPAYVLYFAIWNFLWGLGRYQAEYIGPVLAILVAVAGVKTSRKYFTPLAIACVFLVGYSSQVLRSLNQDHYYSQWSRKRITTESIFPYREALGFLQRQNIEGKFVFIGGVPTYGEWLFYLRGFSYSEMEQHRKRQSLIESFAKENPDIDKFVNTANQWGFNYVVVQRGDKREIQHRAGWHNHVESLLQKAIKLPGSAISLEHRFQGDFEGAIDIYKIGI